MNKAPFFLFSLIIGLFFALMMDRVLGLMHFPKENPVRFAHPSNFHEQRENLEFSYSFRTNKAGIRYDDIPMRKPENEYRVLVLGDSFVEGEGVDEAFRFTNRLEKIFSSETRKVRFINMGLSGTGPQEYERILNNLGFDYEPDAVLICVFANDLSNIRLEENQIQKRRGFRRVLHTLFPRIYTLVSIAAAREQTAVPSGQTIQEFAEKKAAALGIPKQEVEAWKKRIPQKWFDAANAGRLGWSHLTYGLFRPDYLTDALDVATPKALSQWEMMAKVLSRMVETANEKGVKAGIVFIPFQAQYDPVIYDENAPPLFALSGVRYRREWLTEISAVEDRLGLLSARLNVPLLDLTPRIRAVMPQDPELNFPLDGHWNSFGHAWAAEEIAGWIKENQIVRPGKEEKH